MSSLSTFLLENPHDRQEALIELKRAYEQFSGQPWNLLAVLDVLLAAYEKVNNDWSFVPQDIALAIKSVLTGKSPEVILASKMQIEIRTEHHMLSQAIRKIIIGNTISLPGEFAFPPQYYPNGSVSGI